jgi:hypothetical protein
MNILLKAVLVICFISSCLTVKAQEIDPWIIKADNIDRADYYGITVANGMIGSVSSPDPFKVSEVVLAGAYDSYGRGRVSNFLRSFNLLNMNMDIDNQRVDNRGVSNLRQELNMKVLNSLLISILVTKHPYLILIIH